MDPVTDTDICNLALSAIGTRSTIANLNEGSIEANACLLFYPRCRGAILRAAHWDFARKQASLTLLADATLGQTVPQPWMYEYSTPTDCLRIRFLMPVFSAVPGSVPGTVSAPYTSGPPVRFLVSSDVDVLGNDQQVILTNQNLAIGVYTKLITNPNLFDELFIDALSAYLAARMCKTLTGSTQLQAGLFNQAKDAVAVARAANGNEGLTVDDHTPDWIRARGYLQDWAYPPGSIWMCQPQQLTMIA